MPEQATIEAAKEDLAEGKSPSTAAGEFVKQEMDHIREGKHGARSAKQAIAIGLSEARRAGVPLAPPKGDAETRKKAARDIAAGARGTHPSKRRSRARVNALKKEGRSAASHAELSRQTKTAA